MDAGGRTTPGAVVEGRVRECCIACGDVVNGFDAASRAAAGYFLLLAQEKVTKEKGSPEPPTLPVLLASPGREPNSPNA